MYELFKLTNSTIYKLLFVQQIVGIMGLTHLLFWPRGNARIQTGDRGSHSPPWKITKSRVS